MRQAAVRASLPELQDPRPPVLCRRRKKQWELCLQLVLSTRVPGFAAMETGVVSAVEDTAVMKREMAETATDVATMRHVAKVMMLGLRFLFLR